MDQIMNQTRWGLYVRNVNGSFERKIVRPKARAKKRMPAQMQERTHERKNAQANEETNEPTNEQTNDNFDATSTKNQGERQQATAQGKSQDVR